MVSNKTLQEVFDMVQEVGIIDAADKRGVSVDTIKDYLYRYESRINDNQEIITSNVRAKKQVQKFQDTNRIERKAFREYARIENAVSEQNKEMIALLKEHSFKKSPKRVIQPPEDGSFGIFHITDAHLNELVDLHHNKYDITIASKRYARFVDEAILDFTARGISHVLVAFTGDMLNSDRRLDEKLNMATNRVRAQFLAVELFKQVIEELANHFNIWVASVSGNESRVNDEWEWSDACVTDNYDYTIHNMLRILLEYHENVEFCGDCDVEKVINFGGKNILLMHGNALGKNYDVSITKVKARYANHGTIIDYIIFGHLHEPRISGLYARAGSPVGANAYSENGLQLSSVASQNLYYILDDGIDGRTVLLQNVDNIVGYDLHDELMMYNAKSASKLKDHVTVFKVEI